jgi:hypothetical protein
MSATRDRKRQRNMSPGLESLDLRIAPTGFAGVAHLAGAHASPMYVIRGEPPMRMPPTPIFQPDAGASPMYRIRGGPPMHMPPTPIFQPDAIASPIHRGRVEPPLHMPPTPI